MNWAEVVYQLLTDEVDRQRVFALLPTIQADINMVADDIAKLGHDLKTLNMRLTPLFDTMKRISG